MKMFSEPDGKPSFGRVFGALTLLSVLGGWWMVLLARATKLPDSTTEILAIALIPYGIGKVSGAWAVKKNGI